MGYRISLTYVYSATWIVRGPFLLCVVRSFLILSRVAAPCREIRMTAARERAVRTALCGAVLAGACVPCRVPEASLCTVHVSRILL